MDWWDWLAAIANWLINWSSPRTWLFALLVILIVWWIAVPYFNV